MPFIRQQHPAGKGSRVFRKQRLSISLMSQDLKTGRQSTRDCGGIFVLSMARLTPAMALLQVCLIVFGVVAPSLLGQPSQDVPACCRRDGKHHCAMHMAATENGRTVQSQSPDCPYRSQARQTNRTQGIPLQHVVTVLLRTEVLESTPSIFETCHRVTLTTGRSPPSFLL